MIQIIGYMVAVYGIARLVTVAVAEDKNARTAVALVGVVLLVILVALLSQQASQISSGL